jgi:hypothetical protein
MISTKSEDVAKSEAHTTIRCFSKLSMLYASPWKYINYLIDLKYT